MRFHSAVPIGSGGTGRVLRAFDPELGHEVALKLLHQPTPALALRMQREASAQARLDHPNVARVYSSGEADGQPYIAMQLIDGVALDQAAAGLTLDQRVRLLLPVIEGIHAAHRLGLVHRDLKPSNILVERGANDQLTPYVLDFGLVQDHASSDLTAAGEILGTPGYLSPEQAGSDRAIDARSDVFSLGVILYQLSCDQLPFQGDSVAACIASLLQRDPLPPHRVNPRVPMALSRIIQQCLEKDPAARYRSARALQDDLQAWLDDRPVRARSYGPGRRFWRWCRRSPARMLALALTLSLPLLVAGLLLQARFERTRLLGLAQSFTAAALDIEREMQLAALWPDQDLARHRARLRPQMLPLERAYADSDPALRRVAAEPLARALDAIGERDALLAVLQSAWEQGLRSPELLGRQGRAFERVYFEGQARLATIADPELRRLESARLNQLWLQPALSRFDEVVAAASASAEGVLARALLAHHGGADDLALQILDELPPAALDAARLAAQWRLHEALRLVDDGDQTRLALQLDAAEAAYQALSTVARSLPEAWSGLCHIAIVRVRTQSRSGGSDDLPAALDACNRAPLHDGDDAELVARQAHAYSTLARRAVMLGRSPMLWLEQLRASVGSSPSAQQALALGETLISASEHLRRSGADGDLLLAEAQQILGDALRDRPGDVQLVLVLGSAQHLTAIYSSKESSDPNFTRAVATLEQALALQELLSTRLRLGEVLAWWGNSRYHRMQDPAPQLQRAIALLEPPLQQHPDDLRVLGRLAFARWTQGQYEAATGADAEAQLLAAETLYDKVLELDPVRSSARFNRLSVQFTLARHRLQRGLDAEQVLQRAERGFPHLAQTPIEPDLRLQKAALTLLQTRQRARGAPLPASAFDPAREQLIAALELPRDRAAAAMQLADLWVQRAPEPREAEPLAADFARIDTIAADHDPISIYTLHRARMLRRAARSDRQRYGEQAQAALAQFATSPFWRPYADEG